MSTNSISRVHRLIAALLFVGCVMPVGGCRICADCEPMAFPAYGGSWQRTDRSSGRVGSVFDPGGAKTSQLADRDTPPDPDELERRRQAGKSNMYGPDAYEPRSDSDQPPMDDQSPEDRLRDRQLDDIESDNEEDLRNRQLDDINVYRGPNPSNPVTTALRNILPF